MTHFGRYLGVFLLLFVASLSGCLGGEDEPDASDDANASQDGAMQDENATADVDVDTDANVTSDVDVVTEPPVAAFEIVVNGTLAAGDEFTVDASTTTDPDTALENLTFAWNFGDNSTAEGVNATYSFANPGTYEITLNVTDPEGNFALANQSIEVASGFTPGVVTVLAGSVTVPNPTLAALPLSFGTLAANGACATALACYTTFGGVEGQSYQLHQLEDMPAGAGSYVFEDSGATETLGMAVFDADGNLLAGGGVDGGTGAKKLTVSEPTTTSVQVIVFTRATPAASYEITVTALAPEA